MSKGLCCIALLGVWSWRETNEHGGKTALPDWELIALNGRDVYITFDSDAQWCFWRLLHMAGDASLVPGGT